MVRWQPGARERLQRAALELYAERGFEATTVAHIAERAGLTERTFFRHYADKREVVFAGAGDLQDLLAERVAAAAPGTAPVDAVAAALDTASAFFEDRRTATRGRRAVIAAHPDLQERELIKLAALTAAVGAALRARGVDEPGASLAAEAGIAVFKVAVERWTAEEDDRTLAQVLTASFDALRDVTAGGRPAGS